MPEIIKYEVIIIGGGVAGAAAAILLARAGKKILLLEKEKVPHHKVCGEFISYEAEFYLKNLGIDLEKLGAKHISKMQLLKGKSSAKIDLPFTACSLSRFKLDEALLTQAEIGGAEIQCETMVNHMTQTSTGEWQIETSAGEFTAKTIFLATGKHDLRGWNRPKTNDLIGFKMHFIKPVEDQRVLLNTVKIILFKSGYAGLEPIEDGKINLCLVVKKSRYNACGKNWKNLLNDISDQTPELASFLERAKPCWEKPLAIFHIPYGYIYNSYRKDPPGLYRLGDQIAVIPSFCGEGMAIALHTAHEAVFSYLNDDAPTYHHRMKKHLSRQINTASLLSGMNFNPAGQYAAMVLGRAAPFFIKKLALQTRIRPLHNKAFKK